MMGNYSYTNIYLTVGKFFKYFTYFRSSFYDSEKHRSVSGNFFNR